MILQVGCFKLAKRKHGRHLSKIPVSITALATWAVRSSLEWLATQHLHVSAVLHILVDFLLIAPNKDQCSKDLHHFLDMCKFPGVPIAEEKTVGPGTTLEFAGIELDSVHQEARLSLDNLTKCRTLLHQFYKKRSVTLRELQSLIGLLNFCCSVVILGRAFLRRLIDLTTGLTRPHHHIRLNREAKLDIRMWLDFLDNFNGRDFFIVRSLGQFFYT